MRAPGRLSLKVWALVIAVALWFQVNGQGRGTLSVDAPLQVVGLPEGMVVINDLPDHVRLTVQGLQTRLKRLRPGDVVVALDASDIESAGVVERSLRPDSIVLPAGLTVEKIQPDRVQLQVDRVVRREMPVRPSLDLPEDWEAVDLRTRPEKVTLEGPEVWIDALGAVRTTPVTPKPEPGPFTIEAGVESPSGKGIRVLDDVQRIVVTGVLRRKAADGARNEQGGRP
ncbi:MAG: CdaR family protein [Mariprofundaceae bacterium]